MQKKSRRLSKQVLLHAAVVCARSSLSVSSGLCLQSKSSLVCRAECKFVQCWWVGFFFFGQAGRQTSGAPWCCGGGGGGGPVCLPLSRLAARQGDVAQMENRKWMSLRVKDPTLQRHQVVAGEQQVQIPGGVGGGQGKGSDVCVGGFTGKGKGVTRREKWRRTKVRTTSLPCETSSNFCRFVWVHSLRLNTGNWKTSICN